MAFLKENAECPFCRHTAFHVDFYLEDMPMSDDPGEPETRMTLVCNGCGGAVFTLTRTQGGELKPCGVAICHHCLGDPGTGIHPGRMKACPVCGGNLEKRWWRGKGFAV